MIVMRERRYLTFDTNDPRHIKALSLYMAQPDKLKSEFVIGCILQCEQEQRIENIIRDTISEALSHLGAIEQKTKVEATPTSDISELPSELLSMMEDFEP